MALTVLVVEDDASVARFLDQALREADFDTRVVDTGSDALREAKKTSYDLILLDVMLPGMSGIEVCRQARAVGVRTPILMITARDTLADKVEGLDSGADDYIVKPFETAELMARIRALLRREAVAVGPLKVAGLVLDPHSRTAERNGRTIHLSHTEYALLEMLMRKAGGVVTRQDILRQVWQYDFGGRDNVLDVYISYLRDKLDAPGSPSIIKTVRGRGYMIGEESAV
ncbi:MAG: response regulator transcription factor [Armatimonadetes bacterium]|nr:response regulator transcription factor [Armatimonadota bacterium]